MLCSRLKRQVAVNGVQGTPMSLSGSASPPQCLVNTGVFMLLLDHNELFLCLRLLFGHIIPNRINFPLNGIEKPDPSTLL